MKDEAVPVPTAAAVCRPAFPSPLSPLPPPLSPPPPPPPPPLSAPAPARDGTQVLGPNCGKLCSELFTAVLRGDLPGLQALLKQGVDPNSRNGLELTPLFIAAASGQTEMMDALIQAGAQVNASTP